MNQELLECFIREIGGTEIRVRYERFSITIKLILTLCLPFISVCVGVYGIVRGINELGHAGSVLNHLLVGGVLFFVFGLFWLCVRLWVFIKSKDLMINRDGLHSIMDDRNQLICDWSEILNVQNNDAIVMCKLKGKLIVVATKYSRDFWPISQLFCLLSRQFIASSNKSESCGGIESECAQVSKLVEYFRRTEVLPH